MKNVDESMMMARLLVVSQVIFPPFSFFIFRKSLPSLPHLVLKVEISLNFLHEASILSFRWGEALFVFFLFFVFDFFPKPSIELFPFSFALRNQLSDVERILWEHKSIVDLNDCMEKFLFIQIEWRDESLSIKGCAFNINRIERGLMLLNQAHSPYRQK